MGQRADTRRADGEGTRIGPGAGDEFRHRRNAEPWAYGEQLRRAPDRAQRQHVTFDRIRDRPRRRNDREGTGAGQQQSVAVGGDVEEGFGRRQSPGAAAVLDVYRLHELATQRLCHQAGCRVARPPGGIRHQDSHGTGRKILRSACADRRQQHERCEERSCDRRLVIEHHSAAVTMRPVGSTYQRSLLNGLPFSRATSQSATSTGGNGPRLAAGTLPTECRLSA